MYLPWGLFYKYKYLLGAPTPSARSNLTTPAEHLRESRALFSLMLAHLGALGRHVGPLGRHLVPLARHLIANMSENVPKSSKTASKMPQTPLPSLPKVQKCRQHVEKTSEKRNLRANIFQDSPQDASDTSSEPPQSTKNKKTNGFSMFYAFQPLS